MKQKNKMAIGAFIFALCLTNSALAQLIWPATNAATPFFSKFGEIAASGLPANQTRSIGIGQFTTPPGGLLPDVTHAFLHVNSNYLLLPANGSIAGQGFVFRTDGPNNTENNWRLWTGGQNAGNPASEKFRLFVPALSSNAMLYTPQASSSLLLTAGTSSATGNSMMQITSLASTGNNGTGQLLIQPQTADIAPLMNIGGAIRSSGDLVGTKKDATILYGHTPMTGNPNTEADDGFRMKYRIDAQGLPNTDCLIFEKTDHNGANPDGGMLFINTGNDGVEELSMVIEGNGNVGVGHEFTDDWQPQRRLDVWDERSNNPQLRLSRKKTGTSGTGGGPVDVDLGLKAPVTLTSVFTDFETTDLGDLSIVPFDESKSGDSRKRFIGIHKNNPKNNLEINSTIDSPYGATNSSGLRFTNLTSGSTTVPNGTNGVNTSKALSLDDDGDVVLINVAGGGGTVAADNGLSVQTDGTNANSHVVLGGTPLHQQTTIDLNGNNLFFTGAGKIRVNGTSTGLTSKFQINSDVASGDVMTVISTDASTALLEVIEENNGGKINIQQNNTTKVRLNSDGESYFMGGNLAVGTYIPQEALHVVGNIVATGTITANFSDIRLKRDTTSIRNASEIIASLHPKSFYYRTNDFPQMKLSEDKQYGLVAQEVETILPELVKEHPLLTQQDSLVNYKSLNYNAFIAILIKGMQEQQAKIDSLASIINSQPWNNGNHAMVQSSAVTVKDVELSDKHIVILNQNQPNPFNEQTTITYNIPEGSGFAQILFYNAVGQLIKAVDISEKGAGQLNVFANDLSNGIYSYALVIDGKIVDTKKMLKQK